MIEESDMNISDDGGSDHRDDHGLGPDSAPPTISMRKPCRGCSCPDGVIVTKGGQDTVRCQKCGTYAGYNASRLETGRARRSLRTRPDISVTQRARILLRDNRSCFWCHRRDLSLEVGHMVSVHDGRRMKLSEAWLFGDENLVAMCDSCNSGLGRRTVPARFIVAALWARDDEDGRDDTKAS